MTDINCNTPQEIPTPTHRSFKDLTGFVFHKLTVLRLINKRKYSYRWLCECECGNITIVQGGNLRAGHTKSCGCEVVEFCKRTHTTHGMSRKSEFLAFSHAKTRCNNPNAIGYHNYGGRGIKVLFTSFEEFFEDIGKRPSNKHTIDRINVNKHYEKGNVRWATSKTQNRNRRNNTFIAMNGCNKTLAEWCEYYSIRPTTVLTRINRQKWCITCAFTIPSNRGRCEHKSI